MDKILITKIEVKDLFDTYSYSINYNENQNIDDLAILYGDNGCGKTTILKILFHVLSEEPTNGHRTAIGKVAFKEYNIYLSNNYCIKLFRDEAFHNSYSINVHNQDDIVIKYKWEPREIRTKTDENEIEYMNFCKFLSSLKLNVFFLQDDRKIVQNDDDNEYRYYITETGERRKVPLRKGRQTNLDIALSQFNQWIKNEALIQTNIGSESVNELYEKIIGSINNEKNDNDSDINHKVDLIQKFHSIKTKNIEYMKLGLTSNFLNESIIDTITKVNDSKISLVSSIITPYLDSFELRLDSLQKLKDLLEQLNVYLEKYFRNKIVDISLNHGIVIKSKKGIPLAPNSLSSGERQILQLFCHVIVASNKSNLIIIDEPEISLNVKWQRMFLSSLLNITKNNSQIIIATHSIEMISKFKNKVCPLRDLND